MYNRRSFLKILAGCTTLASMPLGAKVTDNIRVIVVGGGVAGTRTAAYLKMSSPGIDITLFDRGFDGVSSASDFSSIKSDYRPVTKQVLTELGIRIVTGKLMQIDPADKSVEHVNGEKYKADVLVVAPGVEFKWHNVPGYEPTMRESVMHAWQHPHAELPLWQQLESMRNGDTVIISVPKAPYRFPLGPYQRATRIAEYLKVYKTKSALLVLDGNDSFPSMHAYREQWNNEFPDGRLQWIPSVMGDAADKIDFQRKTIYTAGESIKAGVLNYIPPQYAGSIARKAELNVDSDWCQVNPETMESSYYKDVYVVGDANDANTYNKTAAMADKHSLRCMASIKTLVI